MATWHQERGSRLQVETRGSWAVVTDPPNQCRAVTTGFTSREEAQAYIDRCDQYRPGEARHCVIVAPAR